MLIVTGRRDPGRGGAGSVYGFSVMTLLGSTPGLDGLAGIGGLAVIGAPRLFKTSVRGGAARRASEETSRPEVLGLSQVCFLLIPRLK